MRTLNTGRRTAGKLAVIAIAAVVVTIFVGRDASPAAASHTAIIISRSPVSPVPVSSALFINDGDPSNDDPTTYHVWAIGVDDPDGLAAYQVEFYYNSWLVGVTSFSYPPMEDNWLFSTNRSGPCQPSPPLIEEDLETAFGHGQGGCSTVGGTPPAGPQGDGLLASFTINPGPTVMSTPMDFSESFLIAARVTDPPSYVPTTTPQFYVTVSPCGDIFGDGGPDGQVTLSDILFEAEKFGKSEDSPDWDAGWDMDGNGEVTLDDILLIAEQFGVVCTA